jgi:multidrug efflux pump subunit AcrA (membrane-fusion protein)
VNRFVPIAVILAVGGTVGALVACSTGPEAVAAAAPKELPPAVAAEAVAPATTAAPAPSRTAPAAPASFVGVVTTKQSRVVTAEFEGRIDALLVTSGQTVKAGDPIAKLDDSQLAKSVEAFRNRVAAARSAVTQAGIEVSEARRRHALEVQLERGGSSTMEAVRAAKADRGRTGAMLQQYKADYESAVSELERIEELLQHATLTAPLDGQVSTIRLKEGELAVTGTPVARIFDPSDRWVRFAMPADTRDAAIKIGARVEVTVPGVGGAAPAVLPATVVGLSNVLEPPLQLTVVEADLDDTRSDTALAAVGTTVDVRRMP